MEDFKQVLFCYQETYILIKITELSVLLNYDYLNVKMLCALDNGRQWPTWNNRGPVL